LNIEYRALERLIHRICNPRTHNDAQVVQIAASIVEFGWTYPVPVDGDNGAIA
jgi:ParB-like chromosome segregation protein Spo0J